MSLLGSAPGPYDPVLHPSPHLRTRALVADTPGRAGRSQERSTSRQRKDSLESRSLSRSDSPECFAARGRALTPPEIFAFSPCPSRAPSCPPPEDMRMLDPEEDYVLAQRRTSVPLRLKTRRETFAAHRAGPNDVEVFYALGHKLTLVRAPHAIRCLYDRLLSMGRRDGMHLSARQQFSLLVFASFCTEHNRRPSWATTHAHIGREFLDDKIGLTFND